MTREEGASIVEAILFTMGDSVEPERLAEVLELDEDCVESILREMQVEYSGRERGITLKELDGSWQICTKIETYDYIKKLVSRPKKRSLTDVLLETLSIIAYKQPVTRQEIEAIRGVNTYVDRYGHEQPKSTSYCPAIPRALRPTSWPVNTNGAGRPLRLAVSRLHEIPRAGAAGQRRGCRMRERVPALLFACKGRDNDLRAMRALDVANVMPLDREAIRAMDGLRKWGRERGNSRLSTRISWLI